MHLVVHQVVELEIVHEAHGDFVFKGFAGAPVIQDGLAVRAEAGLDQRLLDVLFVGAVKHGVATCSPAPAPPGPDALPAPVPGSYGRERPWGSRRCQGGAIRQEGHVGLRHDAGHDALVAVAAGHLVAHGDLALLGNVDPNHLVDAGGQLVLVFPGEQLHRPPQCRTRHGAPSGWYHALHGPFHRRWRAAGVPPRSARSRPWG